MKVRWMMLAILLAVAGAGTFAHGNKVHIRGTIEKIGGDSLQVKTPEGKSVEVKLTASTVYLLHVTPKHAPPSDSTAETADKPSKLGDLAVGDAVVIHATPKGGGLEAEEIRFVARGSNKMASSAGKPKP